MIEDMFFIKHLKIGENIDNKNFGQQKSWETTAFLAVLLRGP